MTSKSRKGYDMIKTPTRTRLLLSVILITIFLLNASPLAAQASVTDTTDAVRRSEIQRCLENDRFNAGVWWYSWLGAYTAATIGQGAVYLSSGDKQLRQDMALGSVTTLLGAAGQLVTPLVKKEPGLNQYNQELLFLDLAEREKAGRSWKVHAVTGAVNLGSGLITWLGFKRPFRDGVENFLLNTAITEAQIWTQPVRASRDYRKYYGKETGAETSLVKTRAECFVCVYPGGVSLNVRF